MEFSKNNLKTKSYFIGCQLHTELKATVKSINRFWPDLIKCCDLEVSEKTNHQDIFKEISSGIFYGYASLFFFVEFECDCDINQHLNVLFKAINDNDDLKYITKVVLTHANIKIEYNPKKFIMTCIEGEKRRNFKLPKKELIRLRLKEKEIETQRTVIKWLFTNTRKMRKFLQYFKRHQNFLTPCVDNLILIQWQMLDATFYPLFGIALLMELSKSLQKKSIQEITMSAINIYEDNMSQGEIGTLLTTSTMGCYVFSINPALAIIINHLSFTKFRIRTGSLFDIKVLRETFVGKKIPHLVLSDGSAEDVKRLMSKVQNTQFSGLKYLYIIVMSHGDEGDIVYTKTDSYNINDEIIKPLMSNATLQNVQKFVLLNACRGSYDPRYDDDDLEFQPTQVTEGDERLVKIFSARKGCVSLLESDGSIFVKKFCNIFRTPFNEHLMELIIDEVESQLCQEWDCFESGVTEYCIMPGTQHHIKMEFENLEKHEELLDGFRMFVDVNKIVENEVSKCNYIAINM